MKKTISELRKFRSLDKEQAQHQSSLTGQLKTLASLQADNKREENYRRNKAVNDRALLLATQKNPVIGFMKRRAAVIAAILALIWYLADGEIQPSIWVSVGTYICLTIVGKLLLDGIKKSYLAEAEVHYKHIDFGKDLRDKETRFLKEIHRTIEQIEISKAELEVLENKIAIKVRELLSEEKLKFILSDQFYNSTDWKQIRELALATFKKVCVRCGSKDNLAVDHIYPRSRFPERALDIKNTQILCLKCNSSKGNRIDGM